MWNGVPWSPKNSRAQNAVPCRKDRRQVRTDRGEDRELSVARCLERRLGWNGVKWSKIQV